MPSDADQSEEETLILDAVDQFLERDVRPYVRALEADDEYPQDIADKMAEMGLFGATISADYGGLGLPAATYSKIVERVSAVWMSVSGIFNSHLIMCASVERFGTEEMKQNYLPKFASGEMRGGIALTEPDCGTDLQGVRTKAEIEGNAYVINGTKMWCTNAVKGNVLAVLAKTDQEAEGPRHKGMSLLLVEKDMGYKASKLKKLGYKGVDTGEVQFDAVRVPVANLIGPEEGKGLNHILAGLELGRINVASRGVGVARACLEESVAYAQTRKTFGKPICEHQTIQIKLADMATKVEAARLLTEQAAAAYDR
ncbi:MAG: acyl-CoA dehydrogenase, partial [Rhodospirillaceae bacterium]|nr:acyl-CoA dehydrogenase [Rhodospirillaceae bacterium]